MKLNVDCVRKLFLCIEKNIIMHNDGNIFTTNQLLMRDVFEEIKDESKEDIVYSVKMMKEAGYIEAVISEADAGILRFTIYGMTYSGHEYLEKIRDPKIWKSVKEAASSVGSWSITLISEIASKVLIGLIENKIPGIVSSLS